MTQKNRDDIFLSLIIPAYNEENRIARTLIEISQYLDQQEYLSEIIVVNDGSTDQTHQRCLETLKDRPNFRVLSRDENIGKGYSVKQGVLQTRGNLILFSDADLSTPIRELDKFLPWVKEYEIVIGSRALPDSDIQVHQSIVRESMGKMFNIFVRLLIIRGIKDTQCGFKLFQRGAALDIFPRIRLKGFSFDVEVLFLSRRLAYRLKQIPVIWRNSPESKVHLFSSSARMFLDLLRIRYLHLSLSDSERNHG